MQTEGAVTPESWWPRGLVLVVAGTCAFGLGLVTRPGHHPERLTPQGEGCWETGGFLTHPIIWAPWSQRAQVS